MLGDELRAVKLPLLLKLAAGRSGGIYAVVGPTVSFLTDAFDEDKNPFDTNTFQGLIGYGFMYSSCARL